MLFDVGFLRQKMLGHSLEWKTGGNIKYSPLFVLQYCTRFVRSAKHMMHVCLVNLIYDGHETRLPSHFDSTFDPSVCLGLNSIALLKSQLSTDFSKGFSTEFLL